MSPVVRQLSGRSGTSRFVAVPWVVHRDARPWVPPLRAAVRDALDEKGNPFYRNASRALFVAERHGRPVGRIAAIENHAHNRHHDDSVGFFGFFDCVDDPAVATSLFQSAEEWLRGRGLTVARGPVNPSLNHEAGILVEGFEHPPVVMTPWNPPYYADLVEAAGYRKAKDLLGFDIPAREGLAVPPRLGRLAERARRRSGLLFRPLDAANLKAEARKALALYTDAWSENWGFVPPTWDEFWHTARDLGRVIVEDVSFVAEVDGEMVGVMMVARDVNRVLRYIPSGRLWPSSIYRLLTRLPKVRHGRIVLLGLREEYRHRGLFPLFVHEAARRAQEIGLDGAEASWILEGNEALIDPLESMGLRAYKRWRIYEKEL